MEQRSLPANSYLHIVFRDCLPYLFNVGTEEGVKAYFKDLFEIKHTSKLSPGQVSDLIIQIQQHMAETYGAYIRDPKGTEDYFANVNY